jgi:protein-L-isoaspartate(D-aspartate) O-methyltransferase
MERYATLYKDCRLVYFWKVVEKLAMSSSTRSVIFDELRYIMVNAQIKARGITDENVIAAMLKVERHLFVGKEEREYAYDDRPLPIGHGQTISQPFIVALMTQLGKFNGNERVLEIGTGCGYQTAILAELVDEVYSIERVEGLLKTAEARLIKMGYNRIHFRCSDGSLGWHEAAPFDKIVISAAAPKIPQALIDQLATGGRMILPVGSRRVQELYVVDKKEADAVQIRRDSGCVFVPLIGENGWPLA